MSEYQYYDFRAIDRALTRDEMAALRAISTRAAITTTSFTNQYKWGDQKADPSKLLEKYFDAFVFRGELRCLYLGWLRGAQDGGLDEDKMELPVPAGLQQLSGSLHALIEFLEIDAAVQRVLRAESSLCTRTGASRGERH